MTGTSYVLHKKLLLEKLARFQKKLPEIFDSEHFLSVDVFDSFSGTELRLDDSELIMLKYLLLKNGNMSEAWVLMGGKKRKAYTI